MTALALHAGTFNANVVNQTMDIDGFRVRWKDLNFVTNMPWLGITFFEYEKCLNLG